MMSDLPNDLWMEIFNILINDSINVLFILFKVSHRFKNLIPKSRYIIQK